MNKSNVLSKKQQYLAVSLSVILSFLVVWGIVSGATTISTNVNTGGTLTVSGVSTLTGLTTHTGGAILVASSTAVGKFQVNGAFNASSTMNVASDVRIDGGLGLGAENTVDDTILFSALTSDPTATEGRLYYNSNDKLFYVYDGTQWAQVATSTGTGGLTASGDRMQLTSLAQGYVTLGTTTNMLQSSILTLQATSSVTRPLTIYAAANQSANLFQVLEDDTSAELFVIDHSGYASGTALQLTSFLIAHASSTIAGDLTVTGQLAASGSAMVTGNLWVNGTATTTASNGNFETAGTLTVTKTSTLTGLSTLTGGALVGASSTVSAGLHVLGVFNASSTIFANDHIVASSTSSTMKGLGVATSTPSGEISATGSGTTTVYIDSEGATKGGCIQLAADDGTMYRIYLPPGTRSATTTGAALTVEAGSCK